MRPIFAAPRKMRVVGYASGSGNTLWKVRELEQELNRTAAGSPFTVVGLFTDSPTGKAAATARQQGLPYFSLDLREYYRKANRPLSDMSVRTQFDAAAVAQIEPLAPDLILLAGYVWKTTAELVNRFPIVNVHPADLSVQQNGRRAYAGADGVGLALAAGEESLNASSHLATTDIDGGPLLMISPAVTVDPAAPVESAEAKRHYLGLVNGQARLVGAYTVWAIARGDFGLNEAGAVQYRGRPVPGGVRVPDWQQWTAEINH